VAQMRPWLVVLVVMAALAGPAHAQAQAQPAASAPLPPKRLNLNLPKENPAVRANRQATMPGDLPSQRQDLKQIQIPLGKSADAGPSRGGGIDDSAARCRAKRTSEEREACEARLDNI
jgi:hypothetical protein